jgi:Mn2+/Fe2+ NRAMP family transporter
VLAALIILTGVDPVQVVEYSIIFSIVILPLTYLPMLLAASDPEYMGQYANGWLSATLGWAYFILISIAALAAIPLLIITHGGRG